MSVLGAYEEMTLLAVNSLTLLGSFYILHHGENIELRQPRLEELIALLAVHPGVPYTRAQIAYHFWPDSSERQARTNARNLLYKLKRAWPGLSNAIAVERTQVVWRQDAEIIVDVHRFEELLTQAMQSDTATERVLLLLDLAECYSGDFLPACYAEWALAMREQLRASYGQALEKLIDTLLDLRQFEEALQWAKRLRDRDPLHEATYRRLMRIYAVQGNRAAALRVYHDCTSILQKELGVEPSPATLQLHAQLLRPHSVEIEKKEAQKENPQTIQRPRLVGRHAEWQQLQAAWRYTQTDKAHCVVIWGEAGIGKTRLAEELVDWAQRLGHAWASSRSYAAQGALTYAPITEWLRASTVRPALNMLDELWRVELARLLPELLTEHPKLPVPGPLTETWQQQRFFQGILHALQAVSGPLLLHMDDMQWSNQETLALLQFILHDQHNYPVLVVGGIRTEDAAKNGALASLLEALRHNGQLTELYLEPLSREESVELAEQSTEISITPQMAETLYGTSEGHPLFLIETVRSGLTEETLLIVDYDKRPTASQVDGLAQIPPKIYTLIVARLGQLSPIAQQVASIASIIGRAFTYEVLHEATSLDELTLVDALDELWSHRIFREQAGDSYDFSHDRIREVAYQNISRARRKLLHRQIAAALKTIHGADSDAVAGEMAGHYAQAGVSEEALIHYHRAAKIALSQYALAQAEDLFDAALVHAPDDPMLRIQLLQEQSFVFRYAFHLERWQENLDKQQALLDMLETPELHLQIEIELGYSEYERSTSRWFEAVEHTEAAILLADKLGDEAMLARCYLEAGSVQWMQTHFAEAKTAFNQCTRHAHRAGDRILEGRGLILQAQIGMFTSMPAQQIEYLLRQSLAIAEEKDDKLQMADLYHKFSYLHVAQGMGDFSHAEQNSQQAIVLARAVGHRMQEENALSNLGILFTNKGDHRQALKTHELARQLVEGLSNRWRGWLVTGYLGSALMHIGDLARAVKMLTEAGEGLQELGLRHFEVKIRSDLGLLYHLAGEDQKAQEEAHYLLGILEAHSDLRYVALIRTRLGYALEASNRLDEALNMYEQGRKLHDQMGQHYYAMNALAGSARIAAVQGDYETARAHSDTIWKTIAGKETNATVETARTLRTCYTIFLKEDDARAAEVLNTAWAQLKRRASTIDEPTHVAQFWQLADHRFFRQIST